jgi:hypothetical protein
VKQSLDGFAGATEKTADDDDDEDDWGEGQEDPRIRVSLVSKRSINRVSMETTLPSISFPARTRSTDTNPLATDASRQAAHSNAEPRASSKNLARC